MGGGGVRSGGGVSGRGRVGGGQGGCERRIEVFVKIQNKQKKFGGGGSGPGGGQWEGSGWGGQGGCERRIEVFVKNQKKKFFFFWGGESGRGGGGSVAEGVRCGGVWLVGGQGECECNVGGRGGCGVWGM